MSINNLIAESGANQVNRLGQAIDGVKRDFQHNRLLKIDQQRQSQQDQIAADERNRKNTRQDFNDQQKLNAQTALRLSQTQDPNQAAGVLRESINQQRGLGFDTSDLEDDLSRLGTEPFESLANEWNQGVEFAYGAGLLAAPKDATPTKLEKLLAAKARLPEGDPRRATFDAAIAKETSGARGVAGATVEITVPSAMLDNTPEPIRDHASAAFVAAGGGKDGVKAFNTAVTEFKEQDAQVKEKQAAFNTFNVAMNAVESTLNETPTGPFVGKSPALTSDQQKADGAIAAMAPILKQIFRSAGEGVFTDKDQELLLAMLPDRSDRPDVREFKLKNIRDIVAEKMGISAGSNNDIQSLVDKYAD